MRVSVNGHPPVELGAKLEKRLTVRVVRQVVEGVVLSPDEAVARSRRRMQILSGLACSVPAVFGVVIVVAAAMNNLADLSFILPLVLGTAVALGALVWFMFRRNLTRVRARAEALGTLEPAGTAIRVESSGLSVGGVMHAWPDVRIDEVGVAERNANNSTVYYIERLTLSAAGRPLLLDALAITNGRPIVEQTWRLAHSQARS